MFELSQNKSSTVFLPSFWGYKPLVHEICNESLNDVCAHLGYNTDQIHGYWGDFAEDNEIQLVAFEIFSKNIICVLTKEPQLKVRKKILRHFLRDFSFTEQFGNYRAEDILKSGIENRSLDIKFLARVLDIKQPALNGVFTAKRIGYNLFINNGFLTDIDPTDGLNSWAKLWMDINPDLISDYELQAKTYWGDKVGRVIQEVNTQADAYANTPNGFQNEHADLHRSDMGLINFAMLLVCHYEADISFDEFSRINHGRYIKQEMISKNNGVYYQVNNFLYEFAQEGALIGWYRV